MDELALIICSKKLDRTLEEYALTLAGIPPLPTYSQQVLEDKEKQRLYLSYLTALQRAVSVGALQAFPHKFSDNPKEYLCSFKDFLVWTKASKLDLYDRYMALSTSNVDISLESTTGAEISQLHISETPTKLTEEPVHDETQAITVVVDDKELLKQAQRQPRRQTQINTFLTELCRRQDIADLSARNLVWAIKPLVNTANCPVKKFHGFYDGVCVEWKQGTGSKQGSWGKKTFQNFVAKFKSENSKKLVK